MLTCGDFTFLLFSSLLHDLCLFVCLFVFHSLLGVTHPYISVTFLIRMFMLSVCCFVSFFVKANLPHYHPLSTFSSSPQLHCFRLRCIRNRSLPLSPVCIPLLLHAAILHKCQLVAHKLCSV